MASCRAPAWRRFLLKVAPFLFKQCPEENFHWRWDRLCYCRSGQYSSDWHGGIYDFKTKMEWVSTTGPTVVDVIRKGP